MKIEERDLARIVDGIYSQLKMILDPSPIKQVVLLTENLNDTIENGQIMGQIADTLDGLVVYPIIVGEKETYFTKKGDYVVDMGYLCKAEKIDCSNFFIKPVPDYLKHKGDE